MIKFLKQLLCIHDWMLYDVFGGGDGIEKPIYLYTLERCRHCKKEVVFKEDQYGRRHDVR